MKLPTLALIQRIAGWAAHPSIWPVYVYALWFVICAANATFVISIQTSGTDIMWREGVGEAISQSQAFWDWLVNQGEWVVDRIKQVFN